MPALFAAGIALLATIAAPAAQSEALVDRVLRQERFSSADRAALNAGHAVVKTLDTPVRRELAQFGVVVINIPGDRFVERFADIERFERGPGIPQIGRFSSPPRVEDLSALTLPARDIEDVAECEPGDCDVKLPASAMARFRTQVNWSAANATQQAHQILREMVVDLVRAYQANGNQALGQYDDGEEPMRVADEFRGLLASPHPLPLPVPALLAYLDEYPRNRPNGVQEFFYWSVVEFGLKPTLRVNHVMIYPLPGRPSGVSHAIAIKQLYATHYFHTTLELRFLVDDARRTDRGGFYLFSITRSRADGTTGLKGSLLRPVISRRSRNGVRNYLEYLKRQVERAAPTR